MEKHCFLVVLIPVEDGQEGDGEHVLLPMPCQIHWLMMAYLTLLTKGIVTC